MLVQREGKQHHQANCWSWSGRLAVGRKLAVFGGGSRRLPKSLALLSLLMLLSLALLSLGNSGGGLANCQEQLTVESRQQKDNDDLNDAIKYLEKLDKYFSQMARPRFGRSEFKQRAYPAPDSDSARLQAAAFPARYALDLAAASLAQRYRNSPPAAY